MWLFWHHTLWHQLAVLSCRQVTYFLCATDCVPPLYFCHCVQMSIVIYYCNCAIAPKIVKSKEENEGLMLKKYIKCLNNKEIYSFYFIYLLKNYLEDLTLCFPGLSGCLSLSPQRECTVYCASWASWD